MFYAIDFLLIGLGILALILVYKYRVKDTRKAETPKNDRSEIDNKSMYGYYIIDDCVPVKCEATEDGGMRILAYRVHKDTWEISNRYLRYIVGPPAYTDRDVRKVSLNEFKEVIKEAKTRYKNK